MRWLWKRAPSFTNGNSAKDYTLLLNNRSSQFIAFQMEYVLWDKQFKQKMLPHNWVKRWKITMLTVIILKGGKITFFPTNFNCCLMIPSQQLLEPVCNSRDGWNRNSDRITKIRKKQENTPQSATSFATGKVLHLSLQMLLNNSQVQQRKAKRG